MNRVFIVSAVNLIEGGPLTVLRDCLKACRANLPADWDIYALVNKPNLAEVDGVKYIYIPLAKRSWIHRIYYEYIKFYRISKRLSPTVWLSLHDITPNVLAPCRVVYCHNPSPFYSSQPTEFLLDPAFYLFTKLYRALYSINIKSNSLVIVQQEWIRREFQRLFKISNVAVAYPVTDATRLNSAPPSLEKDLHTFFYPAFPRIFKNHALLCEAAIALSKLGADKFEIILTVDGKENLYAKKLVNKYSKYDFIKFIGKIDATQVSEYYKECTAVIFPSKLETWGLPISEAKQFNKILLAADLPYAHEAVGEYGKCAFFNPNNPDQLAKQMFDIYNNSFLPEAHHFNRPCEPFAPDWPTLIKLIYKHSS